MHCISAIFKNLPGVKQGCQLSPTLFGLYVDGLEEHLLETADIDAPTLFGTLHSLWLYADDTGSCTSMLQRVLNCCWFVVASCGCKTLSHQSCLRDTKNTGSWLTTEFDSLIDSTSLPG